MNKTTPQKSQPDELTKEIKDEILIVRDTGKTNMFNFINVQRIAYQMDLFGLVNFLSNQKNYESYFAFILHGDKKTENENK